MLEQIHQHYNDRLTLAGLAKSLRRQSAYLGRLFRDEVGLTVHEYVTRARMIFASVQVRAGVKIEAVSLELGYRSKKNFYNQFKRRFGMTPDAYRVMAANGTAASGRTSIAATIGSSHGHIPRRAAARASRRESIAQWLTGSNVAMLVTDERGRYVGATEAAVSLSGYSVEELRGMPPDKLFPTAADSSSGCRLQVLHPTSTSRPATSVLQTKSAGRVHIHLTSVDLSGTAEGFRVALARRSG
jgi:PAS domain S-box-containing protein